MRARKLWLLLVPFVVLLVPWAGILKTDEVDHCDHCMAVKFRARSFWFGVKLDSWESPWSKSFRSQVCVALERPCSHSRQHTNLRRRWWGGLYCACPCINGTVALSFHDWLTPERRAAIERIAEKDPQFADEFIQRCLLNKDQDFFKETGKRICSGGESNLPIRR